MEETEQSIPDWLGKQVFKYPDRLAIKTRTKELTYDTLASNPMKRPACLVLTWGPGGARR